MTFGMFQPAPLTYATMMQSFKLRRTGTWLLFVSICLFTSLQSSQAADALKRNATWEPPSREQQTERFRAALAELGTEDSLIESAVERVASRLSDAQSDALDTMVRELAAQSPVINEVISLVDGAVDSAATDEIQRCLQALGSENWQALPSVLRHTCSVWVARTFTQRRFFDEAINAFSTVDPIASLDPASAFFYRGACNHALLKKDAALSDLEKLLENESDCPLRYSRTAKMMLADIKPLKEDTLDEISRIMGDVTRRLDLGRTGKQVKDQEQKIIDKLDKLIEELEQQQQQQQQQQQASSGQGGSSEGSQGSPMNDSQIAGGNGNGDVDRKKIEQKDGWGNLPPAERQEAIQQISRDLPTHYREAIEAYFRKLATDQK